MTARPLFGALLALAALGGGVQAEEPAANPAEKAMRGCEQMMQKHKDDLAALESKTAAMNAAQGSEKMDAIAAVVNELVTQQRTMQNGCPMMGEKMGGMMGGGMKHDMSRQAPAPPSEGAPPE
jgi:hypothetical protein